MRFLREVGPKIGQGLRIAQIDSGRIEPYHGLSMLTGNLFEPKRAIELDDQQAKNFMLGQSIPSSNLHDLAQSSDTPWCVARWNSKPIGWLKSASNRWNNYLPTWARFSSFSSDSASDNHSNDLFACMINLLQAVLPGQTQPDSTLNNLLRQSHRLKHMRWLT
jgi:NOL1/NOP2/fmu family ribosome biogenesis protein